MNEYVVLFLNGIEKSLMATDWKDAIIEGKLHAERQGFANNRIKMIADEDNEIINEIDVDLLTFKFKKLSGNQAEGAISSL